MDSRPLISESIKTCLLDQGFLVLHVKNDTEALKQLFSDPPEITLIEAALSGGSGIQLCRWIHVFTQTPIILLGSDVDETEVIAGLLAGADDYVSPPYRYGELLARMESVLRRHRLATMSAKSQVSCQDKSVMVDLTGNRVYVRGKPVALTKTEYGLFTYLMRHPGQTLTPKQLMHAVWGSEYFTFESVAWHICRLRRKVEVDANHPRLIVTVPGFGYRYDKES